MPPEKKKPPGGLGRLSFCVVADGFDFPKDNLPHSKKQGTARGLIPIGSVAAQIVADLKFGRQIERLHRLGPRAVAELLAEIGAERSITTIVYAPDRDDAETVAEISSHSMRQLRAYCALPWPEFRLLAAYITGHESPAISFWKCAVEGEPDGGGVA